MFANNELSEGSCAKGGSKGRKRREELERQFSFTYHFAWDGFDFLKILKLEESGSKMLRGSAYYHVLGEQI